MKVNIEMENLENLVEEAMNKNIETVIKEEVDKRIMEKIEEKAKTIINDIVSLRMEEFVKEYISNAKVTVGGGFYSKDEAQTYTIEQYIKKELAAVMENKTLTIAEPDRYNNSSKKQVSFEKYIKKSFDVESLIKKELDSFMTKTKKDINSRIDGAFTDTTKSMLSETVFNILMRNDTFKKISDNVKCIADKQD